jgi:L-Ala-D/L-Glu epimerase
VTAPSAGPVALQVARRRWPRREPFRLSREVICENDNLIVTLFGPDGLAGRGEACGLPYSGETRARLADQIESVRPAIEGGADRRALQALLPPGGARAALDAALWDLEAKRAGRSVFDLARGDGLHHRDPSA